MKAVSVKQIQNLDKIAIEKIGVPSLSLMENAGRGVAYEVIRQLKGRRKPSVSVICGLGNNAGDGFVVARHLINAGVKTKIFLICKGKSLKTDAAVNYQILKRLRYPIIEIGTDRDLSLRDLSKADIVVDAIFGVGLNREVLDPFRCVIETINKNARRIVSIDTPSGLDGTTGKIYGVCIKANTTVTFSFVKKGFLINQGPKHTGRVIVIDIGIPVKLKKRIFR